MPASYRVGVIGRTGKGDYGHGIDTVWGEVPQTQVVAVADEDKQGLAAACQRLSVERGYADWREMLDKEKPDIVAICPRWIDQHRDMVVAAAERGMHVYMEKPFVRTLAEADECVAACERTHARLAIAHQTQWSPKLAAVRQLIAEGKIGRVLELRGRGKEDSRGGGLDLWVLGSHVMGLIRTLGGEPQWCQAAVTQNGQPIQQSDVAEGAEGIGPLAGDAVHAMYGLPDGVVAYFDSHRLGSGGPNRFGVTVYGTAGAVEILSGYLPSVKYLSDPSWSPGRSGAAWQDVSSAGIGQSEPLQDTGLHGGNVAAVQDLLAAIEEQRQPVCSVYDARGIVEMIAGVFESQRLSARVPFPIANRENPLGML
jgi:predicted dehydrogenase